MTDSTDREYAEAWRPEPGDELIGTVTALDQRDGFDGRAYPIVVVTDSDGVALSFHAFHTVAKAELAKLSPRIGERIAIQYLGVKRDDAGQSRYHRYAIRAVDRPADAFDWRAFGDPAVAPDVPAPPNAFAAEPAPAGEPGEARDDAPF